MANIQINSREEIVIHELTKRIVTNSELYNIISRNNIDTIDLQRIYILLINNGAGIYKNERFVAANALVNPTSLSFLCKNFSNGRFKINGNDASTSAYLVTNEVIQFFMNKEK